MIRHVERVYHGYGVFHSSGYFFVIVEQLIEKVCKVEGVSISHVHFLILLAQDYQILKYYNQIFAELFLKK